MILHTIHIYNIIMYYIIICTSTYNIHYKLITFYYCICIIQLNIIYSIPHILQKLIKVCLLQIIIEKKTRLFLF